MTEHDRTDTDAGATEHRVPASLGAPVVPTGAQAPAHFDPVSLRPAVDADAIEARLAELGASRSTSALGERADLLRMLGRLDEALAISEEAFRLAHFTGDRADSTAARIRRAYVFKEQGRLERALNDLHTSRISAATEEWHELEAAAAELEGYTLFDLHRYEEAQAALTVALNAYEKAGAPAERTNGLRVAIEGVARAVLVGHNPAAAASAASDSGVSASGVSASGVSASGTGTAAVETSPLPPEPVSEPMVSPVVVDAPITLADVPRGVLSSDGAASSDDSSTDDSDDQAAPQFRTAGPVAFLGSPDQTEAPARLSPDAAARLDPDSVTDGAVPDAASIGVETQAIAVPHATAPGTARRIIDDEDRNEDDEPGATGFDAEVARARKAARGIWGAFDASNAKTPPSRS
ncbi:tetratricopeptide repeat protein [Frondihabitans cladoniiphilus]|uniref:Tetratricopeptide repeat protein n=1 Tax=Frondihabitans cladoniiphilus TaxID=715785 RepID=A0ABP8VWB2_9MICO